MSNKTFDEIDWDAPENLVDPDRKNPYEIKALKNGPDFGDGPSWQANLYKDGKKIGIAQYGGTGGPIDIHITNQDERREFAEFANNWRHWRIDLANDESFVDELVTDFENAKEERRIQRWAAKNAAANTAKGFPLNVLFTIKKSQWETLNSVQGFRDRAQLEKLLDERLRTFGQKYPGAEVTYAVISE